MIQITPQMRIFLVLDYPDFRCGIDGLAAICREILQEDPFSGALFLFRNRKGTSVKALVYDGQGYWCMQKRLSSGRFQWWPRRGEKELELASYPLAAHELQCLLWNGNPKQLDGSTLWRPLQPLQGPSAVSEPSHALPH